jgi:hypothetical protein
LLSHGVTEIASPSSTLFNFFNFMHQASPGHHIIARGTARTLCAIADPMRRVMRAARHHCGMCGRD